MPATLPIQLPIPFFSTFLSFLLFLACYNNFLKVPRIDKLRKLHITVWAKISCIKQQAGRELRNFTYWNWDHISLQSNLSHKGIWVDSTDNSSRHLACTLQGNLHEVAENNKPISDQIMILENLNRVSFRSSIQTSDEFLCLLKNTACINKCSRLEYRITVLASRKRSPYLWRSIRVITIPTAVNNDTPLFHILLT